jgi:hypothetical protein
MTARLGNGLGRSGIALSPASMTWSLDIAGCRPATIIRCLYQGFETLVKGRDICGIFSVAEQGLKFESKAMARRLGQLVLGLLPCSAVLANVPVDAALKPCGDAYYYPSKVVTFCILLELVLTSCSIHATTQIFCVRF